MLLILIGLLCLCLILWLYNIKRRALLHFEYQHKLRVLRNELQQLGSMNNSGSWVFDYLDQSMKHAISNLQFFNYYVAWGLHRLYVKDKTLSAFISKLTAEMNQPENRFIKDVHYRFGNLIVEYVTKKHEFFSLVFMKLHSIQEHRNNRDRNKPPSQIINKIKDLRIYQNTVALKEFM